VTFYLAMADNKYPDKNYHYPLKQEPYEGMPWNDNDPDDYKNPGFFMNKYNPKNNTFGDMNSFTINNAPIDDTMSLFNPGLNQNYIGDGDQSIRNNSSFPIFNEKLITNSNNHPELNPNTLNKYHHLDFAPQFKQIQAYPAPMNYFPFTVLPPLTL
jgi:hypothetical protein